MRETFDPGDRVRDTDGDESSDKSTDGFAIALSYRRDDDGSLVPAASHEVNALSENVAKLNPEYPADDPVVTVVFESYLNSMFPDEWTEWRDDDPETFERRIRECGREWGIPRATYDYPESRLELAENQDIETENGGDS